MIKSDVPTFLRPKYFAMIINTAYKAARDNAIAQCSPFIINGHSFTHALALTSVQMYGQVRSASLNSSKETPSLAAGLPHFTSGWARTWGRDVFISLRGLFLVTGQFEAAKAHILAFSEVLKHGLIPNLLVSPLSNFLELKLTICSHRIPVELLATTLAIRPGGSFRTSKTTSSWRRTESRSSTKRSNDDSRSPTNGFPSTLPPPTPPRQPSPKSSRRSSKDTHQESTSESTMLDRIWMDR